MYHAKDSGRNNYQFFKPDMNGRTAERQSLESGLHRAIERQEFVLHYQPKMSLDSGEITGVEALIRWRHPQRGLVPPAQFMPIAEECGVHRADRPVGSARSLPPIAGVAGRGPAADAHRDQHLRGGIARQGFRGTCRRHSGRSTGLGRSDLELELTETFLMQRFEFDRGRASVPSRTSACASRSMTSVPAIRA